MGLTDNPMAMRSCVHRGLGIYLAHNYHSYFSKTAHLEEWGLGVKVETNFTGDASIFGSIIQNSLPKRYDWLERWLRAEELDADDMMAILREVAVSGDVASLSDFDRDTLARFAYKGKVRQLLKNVIVSRNDLKIYLCRKELEEHTVLSEHSHRQTSDRESFCIHAPMTIRRRGQEMRMILSAYKQSVSNSGEALIVLVARAVLLREQLETGAIASIRDFAEAHGMHHSDAKKLVFLGYLAPSIGEDILDGLQPEELTAKDLHRMTALPLCWEQ